MKKPGKDITVTTRTRGQIAEEQACSYLLGQGLSLVERNFNSRLGEIDIIMRDKQQNSLVFVEVRSRCAGPSQRNSYGSTAESVNLRKRQRLIRTAQLYLQLRRLNTACRFDIIAIDYDRTQTDFMHNPTITWINNAFQV